jgi:hypothetical protein
MDLFKAEIGGEAGQGSLGGADVAESRIPA